MIREIQSSLRLGKNFVRKGDPIKVKLPGKTQYRDGFKFKGYDPIEAKALVITPTGIERYVDPEGIKRKQVTKNGEKMR